MTLGTATCVVRTGISGSSVTVLNLVSLLSKTIQHDISLSFKSPSREMDSKAKRDHEQRKPQFNDQVTFTRSVQNKQGRLRSITSSPAYSTGMSHSHSNGTLTFLHKLKYEEADRNEGEKTIAKRKMKATICIAAKSNNMQRLPPCSC